MNNKIEFSGPFKNELNKFLIEKRDLGYKYRDYEYALRMFDRFTIQYDGDKTFLTKNLVQTWLEKRANESIKTRSERLSLIRQFGIYLFRHDIVAYIIPKGYYQGNKNKYIPHIFSNNELKKLFEKIDLCKYYPQYPNRHLAIPIIFRILYLCGLRVSEVLNLKIKDIDWNNRTLCIYDSKGKDRLIPLTDELYDLCLTYKNKTNKFSKPEDHFFTYKNNLKITRKAIYKTFRTKLWEARIPHTGAGPRVHDFRHSMAVHCLRKWVREGKDLNAYFPILKTYLGHATLKETANYLRLTADLFPDIQNMLKEKYNDIIPIFYGDEYEK